MSRVKVVLGTAEFGEPGGRLKNKLQCHEILNLLATREYNDIDSATMYGDGQCEKYIGDFIARNPKTKFSLSTKCNPWGKNSLRGESVREQMSRSLENLACSEVDIFYLHVPDHDTPIEDTLHAVNALHQEGKFKEFGMCNYSSWEVVDAYYTCKKNGWVVPTVYQGMYNAITRMVEPELFPCLRHLGMKFYAYNPLACGMLTGKYKFEDLAMQTERVTKGRIFNNPTFSHLYVERYWRPTVFKGLQLIRNALDRRYGVNKVSLVNAALRWLTHHSYLSPDNGDAIVMGSTSVDQLCESLDACEDGPMDESVLKAFDDAWRIDQCHNSTTYYR